MASEAPSSDELERAKALTEADELGALQRVDEKADRLSMYATLFDDPDLINGSCPGTSSATAEQIRAVCADVFAPDNRVVLTYVPGDRRRDEPERRMSRPRAVVVADRPPHGEPRPYQFPRFERKELANGLGVIVVHLPGRPLVAASLVITSGVVDEPADLAGATVLMARALTEGTERYDAIELVEATERLGASLHAEAGWDSTSVSVDVPADRLTATLALIEEVLVRPTFPAAEVERLRDERLNDILQARADPRRRAEEAFIAAIYAAGSPYRRPAAGIAETVARLDAATSRAELARRFDPARMTLVVGGDLAGIDVPALAAERFGSWGAHPNATPPAEIDASPAATHRRIGIVHRPGSVQTEIRIGHPGVPRRIADYHAVSVMGAVLGGLFNSRLNRKLREEKGYTYGASAGFDLRAPPDRSRLGPR